MKYTAEEIIKKIPDDLETLHYVDDNGYMVTIHRKALIEGLMGWEDFPDPDYSIRSVRRAIAKCKKPEGNKDLASDLTLAFCYELLQGEASFDEMDKVN